MSLASSKQLQKPANSAGFCVFSVRDCPAPSLTIAKLCWYRWWYREITNAIKWRPISSLTKKSNYQIPANLITKLQTVATSICPSKTMTPSADDWLIALQENKKTIAIGTHPNISLKQARTARDEAKEKLLKNIDPSLDKKQEKLNNN
ncbi:MAG: Arm DNA-binding domain-containing protein [Cellvibrio sp.]|uniref:Arm DNA-binding domain-containing protein n=1 Tax=Cellvibrio sp. TaxID=1965322 RepID=UPI00271A3C41|nr:Arm DNA-binding domain-containing protein [Cellvibrio sp.]